MAAVPIIQSNQMITDSPKTKSNHFKSDDIMESNADGCGTQWCVPGSIWLRPEGGSAPTAGWRVERADGVSASAEAAAVAEAAVAASRSSGRKGDAAGKAARPPTVHFKGGGEYRISHFLICFFGIFVFFFSLSLPNAQIMIKKKIIGTRSYRGDKSGNLASIICIWVWWLKSIGISCSSWFYLNFVVLLLFFPLFLVRYNWRGTINLATRRDVAMATATAIAFHFQINWNNVVWTTTKNEQIDNLKKELCWKNYRQWD